MKILRLYASFYSRSPYTASFWTCLVKGAAADAIAQTQIEKNETFSVRRNTLFALWSASYCGCAQVRGADSVMFVLLACLLAAAGCRRMPPTPAAHQIYLTICHLQHYIFNVAFSRAFGTATNTMVALQKAAADSFVATPLLGIPIYYACKPTIEGVAGKGPMDGLREYAGGFADFYWKPAMVWIPAHLLTFSVVAPAYRIVWTATVSIGWLSFVSMTSHS